MRHPRVCILGGLLLSTMSGRNALLPHQFTCDHGTWPQHSDTEMNTEHDMDTLPLKIRKHMKAPNPGKHPKHSLVLILTIRICPESIWRNREVKHVMRTFNSSSHLASSSVRAALLDPSEARCGASRRSSSARGRRVGHGDKKCFSDPF